MPMGKIIGLGHSHLGCMMWAYRDAQKMQGFAGPEYCFEQLNQKKYQPNFDYTTQSRVDSAAPQTDEDIQRRNRFKAWIKARQRYFKPTKDEKIRRLTPMMERQINEIIQKNKPDAILLAVMGNEYQSNAIIQHPVPFDFEYPEGGLPLQIGASRISFALMKAQMQRLTEMNVLLFWRYLNATTEIPIMLVPPPPPIASESHIKSFQNAFSERIKELGISPFPLRKKIWLLYCDVLKQTVAGTSTKYIELPDVIFDDEGGLADEYRHNDPTHGNIEYGQIILEQVNQHFTKHDRPAET